MTERSHPYADTRAASLLAAGLKRYTAQHPGGLRALAADLGIKQATVLSQMGKGRIGIPLDRATELATKLEMDVTDFCLAVLEQRAPAVFEALEDELHVKALASLSPEARRACIIVAAATPVSDEHVEVIAEVVEDRRPAERWLKLSEVPVMAMIRERYPNELGVSELGMLGAAIDAARDLDL